MTLTLKNLQMSIIFMTHDPKSALDKMFTVMLSCVNWYSDNIKIY